MASPSPLSQLARSPGRIYLLTAVLIFAASNSVTRQLIDIGAARATNGSNPVSFCNVLFVGNLCALFILVMVYQRSLRWSTLQQFSGRDWLGMIAVSVLSGALAPALIFTALDITTVNNVILVSRIEPPLALALSVLFLRERANHWVVMGAIFSFIGVALTIFLQTPGDRPMMMPGLQIGLGEALVAVGAIAAAIATVISKISLTNVSLGFFTIVRTGIGTIIFFLTVIVLFSPAHFTDVFTPFLWRWMLIYGAVIVVGGQLLWFAGLRCSQASEVSLANSFNPIAGILASFVILGEIPTTTQYIGGAVILIGIALNQVGIMQASASTASVTPSANTLKEVDIEAGFKGL